MRAAEKIIGPSVMNPLLRRYQETWGHRWPFDRRYLAELVIETKAGLGLKPNDKIRTQEVRDDALVLMRETHHFPDHTPPFGSKGLH